MEEHPLQREFPLMQRMEAPAIVPPQIMRTIKTYRQACRACRQLSPRRELRWTLLADEAGLIAQHCTDYFINDDSPKRRSLPPEKVAAVERTYGNTAITQWHNMQAAFTVLEELQAGRAA